MKMDVNSSINSSSKLLYKCQLRSSSKECFINLNRMISISYLAIPTPLIFKILQNIDLRGNTYILLSVYVLLSFAVKTLFKCTQKREKDIGAKSLIPRQKNSKPNPHSKSQGKKECHQAKQYFALSPFYASFLSATGKNFVNPTIKSGRS